MLFSSLPFLFLFLPVVLIGHYILHPKLRNAFLLVMSLGFYAYGEPKFETQQSCYIRHQDLTRSGSFYDAIFEMKYLNAPETSGLYGTYIGGDYPVVLHESETAQTDKTLLLFIDSFGTIPESYLTTAYKHVYAIDLRWVKILGMPESAADFVEMYNPDHVIVAFNPNQIGGADSEQFYYGID